MHVKLQKLCHLKVLYHITITERDQNNITSPLYLTSRLSNITVFHNITWLSNITALPKIWIANTSAFMIWSCLQELLLEQQRNLVLLRKKIIDTIKKHVDLKCLRIWPHYRKNDEKAVRSDHLFSSHFQCVTTDPRKRQLVLMYLRRLIITDYYKAKIMILGWTQCWFPLNIQRNMLMHYY